MRKEFDGYHVWVQITRGRWACGSFRVLRGQTRKCMKFYVDVLTVGGRGRVSGRLGADFPGSEEELTL